MKFGVSFANILTFSQPEAAKAIGQAAEAAGFDSIWTVEHVLVPAAYESTYPYDPSGRMPAPNDMDLPDPLIWLTWVAAHTSSIRLATGVLVLPQRNPAILAKEIATLDVLSGGRLLLGVGTGWLQEEFDALGVPFAGRGARTDSFIGAMRALWTGEETTYRDDHVTFDRAVSRPRPIAGSVPIHIGGHSEVAARRAGRLGDGFFPGDHQDIAHLIEIVYEHAERAGRDPAAVEVTVTGEGLLGPDPQAEVERLTSLGVHRAVIPPLAFDPAGITEALTAFGDRVIAPST
jgi:probable F420-dependent oxidoreductase